MQNDLPPPQPALPHSAVSAALGAATGPLPARIALLLPLSGRLGDAGESIRDGFLAGYYQLDTPARPELRVYDSGADVVGAYRRAVGDGAAVVVGPLGKENVQAVARVADPAVTTLALNFLPDTDPTPPRFYQYALAPEDEARQVADRLIAEGRRTGVAVIPTGEWGARVLAAFQRALTAGGGNIVATRALNPGNADFSDQLTSMLGFEESERRYHAVTAIVGPLQFTPRRREDLQFVFLAGQPVLGRLVRPQLKFHYAGDLPVYSISDIYDPNPIANQDLEGVSFTDMPWMITEDPAINELRTAVQQLWPTDGRHRGRLFAMGADAWRLVGVLWSARGGTPGAVTGLTGRLMMDAGRQVHRTVDWATVGPDGQLRPLPPADSTP